MPIDEGSLWIKNKTANPNFKLEEGDILIIYGSI